MYFNEPNTRGPSHNIGIKPMAFEYDWIERFASTKIKFVYFFNYSIILEAIKARRTNSGICGPSVGHFLLMALGAKTITIHIIAAI